MKHITINGLTNANITSHNCQGYSFGIENQTCFFKNIFPVNDLLENMVHYGTYQASSVSGEFDCLNKFDTGTVQIKVNKKMVNAFSICSFAKQPIVFEQNLNVRCGELYTKLKTPLIELKNEVNLFYRNFLNKIITRNLSVQYLGLPARSIQY